MKKNKNKNKAKAEVTTDFPLFEYIQPHGGITFKEPNYIINGDGYTKVIHIYKLPTALSDFWLEELTQKENVVATVDIATKDKVEVQSHLNHSLSEEFSRERSARDYEEVYDAQKRQMQLRRMYDEVTSMGEVVKILHFRLFVSGRSLVELEEKCGKIMDELQSKEFMCTIMLNEGEREWSSLYQSYKEQMKKPFAMRGLTLLTEQIAGGYPFRFSDLMDEYGDLLGFTNCNGAVIFDEFTKDVRRAHYHSIAVGDMRSGKSTLLKKRFRSRAERGDFVRAFDVSGEFTEITKEFGGKIIKCDGKEGMLNPLEILKVGEDDSTNFSRHISKVTVFYQCLASGASEKTIVIFQNTLRKLYQRRGLVPGSRRLTGLPSQEYPILSDFTNFIEKEIEAKSISAERENDVVKQMIIAEVLELKTIKDSLENLVENYGMIFDGYTSIDNITDEKIVTFDISTIKELGDVFAAQLFNMVYFCWDNCVSNGSDMKERWESGQLAFEDVTRFLIIIDESHRWVNTKYPSLLDMILVMLREMPKYFAGIMFASQSLRDYVPDGITDASFEKLKLVFELTQYKFIFRQSSSSLPLIDKAFGNVLSLWQKAKIPYLSQGETILSISGDRNIFFKVWLSETYEKPLFKGGA